MFWIFLTTTGFLLTTPTFLVCSHRMSHRLVQHEHNLGGGGTSSQGQRLRNCGCGWRLDRTAFMWSFVQIVSTSFFLFPYSMKIWKCHTLPHNDHHCKIYKIYKNVLNGREREMSVHFYQAATKTIFYIFFTYSTRAVHWCSRLQFNLTLSSFSPSFSPGNSQSVLIRKDPSGGSRAIFTFRQY